MSKNTPLKTGVSALVIAAMLASRFESWPEATEVPTHGTRVRAANRAEAAVRAAPRC